MLSSKPFKVEAILRLLLSVFVCISAGSLVVGLLSSIGVVGGARWLVALLAVVGFFCFGGALVFLRKRWDVPNPMRRAVMAVALFYFGFIITFWIQHLLGKTTPGKSVAEMIVAMFSFQGATIVLVTLFLREQGTSWTEGFGLRNGVKRAIMSGIIATCLFLPVGISLQKISALAIKQVSKEAPEEQQAVQTLRVTKGWFDRVILGIVTILLAPVAEETLFRGIIYPVIKQLGFPRLALVINSLVFAAIHMNLAVFIPLLLLALMLTVLYEKTNNLLAPIVAHATFNGIQFAALYLQAG